MNILKDLGDYIVSKAYANGIGVDLFLDYLPDKPDNCVSLREYDGGGLSRGGESISHSVQVIVRGKEIELLKELAWKLFWLFTDYEPIFLLNGRFTVITPMQSPHKFDVDESGRTAYIFNLNITTTGRNKKWL